MAGKNLFLKNGLESLAKEKLPVQLMVQTVSLRRNRVQCVELVLSGITCSGLASAVSGWPLGRLHVLCNSKLTKETGCRILIESVKS